MLKKTFISFIQFILSNLNLRSIFKLHAASSMQAFKFIIHLIQYFILKHNLSNFDQLKCIKFNISEEIPILIKNDK